ncbi:MAG: hypothetical protein HY904_10970 [Deltaproteobacteria bacterium]|nr:hypothetical protein [Deltaproteobacteria bacterium]
MSQMPLRALAIRLRRSVKQCDANPTWPSAMKWGPKLKEKLADVLREARENAQALRARAKEVSEKNVAMEQLAKAYSQNRLACLAIDPRLMLGEFRSGVTGEDSLAINMDALMDLLETEAEQDKQANTPVADRKFEFAEEAVATLRPLRAAYDKEAAEADAAKESADRATPELAAAEAAATAVFTTYRQLVRAKFGDRSREAVELRNPPASRKATADEPADPEIDAVLPVTPPA